MSETAPPSWFLEAPCGRTFLLVWLGQLVSVTGSVMTQFGLAIWVFSETGSTVQLALVVLAGAVPAIVVSLFAGPLVDRWDRRQSMIVADAGAAVGTLAIVALVATGQLETWHLYIALAWSSVFGAFQFPTFSAATAALVPKTQLSRAAGLVELSGSLGYMIAPAIAGVAVATSGLLALFVIDLATFTVAVLTLLVVRFPPMPVADRIPLSPRALLREAGEGLHFVMQRRELLLLLITFSAVAFAFGFVDVLLVPLLLTVTSESAAGVIVSITALGLVTGSLLMGVWGGSGRRVRDLHVALVVMGAGLILVGVRPWPLLILAAITLAHVAVPIARGTNQAIWLAAVPQELQGRVAAIRQMVLSASTPLALLAAGFVAEHVLEPSLAAGGLLVGIGPWLVGAGEGRSIALLLMLAGAFILGTVVVSWRSATIQGLDRQADRSERGTASGAPDHAVA